MKKILSKLLVVLLSVILLVSCNTNQMSMKEKIQVVTTTTMLSDMAKQILGETADVISLMGPGVDSHLYDPTAGDFTKLEEANIIIYNGLGLEGKLGEVIEHLESEGKIVIQIAENLPKEKLLEDTHEHYHDESDGHIHYHNNCEGCHTHDEDADHETCDICNQNGEECYDEGHECEICNEEHNTVDEKDKEHQTCENCHLHDHESMHEEAHYDSHIWFDVMLWKEASKTLYDEIIKAFPENKELYKNNYSNYEKSLDDLHNYVIAKTQELPQEARILVTAHHAFSYFGRAYGFEVKGLQGISTSAEAGTKDVIELADFIVKNKIKAIFVESNVPIKNIEALQEAVKSKGFEVKIGGELFSDSLGSSEETKTYVGTVKSNIDTIVDALK